MSTYNVNPVGASEKAPEIEILTEQLNKEVSMLIESLGGLEARLQKIMTPDNPRPEGVGVGTPQPPHSQHFIHLDDLRLGLVSANLKISDIKSRLEV